MTFNERQDLLSHHERMIRLVIPNVDAVQSAYAAFAGQIASATAIHRSLQSSLAVLADTYRQAQATLAIAADFVQTINQLRPQLQAIGASIQQSPALQLMLTQVADSIVVPFLDEEDVPESETLASGLTREQAIWWSWVVFYFLACVVSGNSLGIAATHGIDEFEVRLLEYVGLLMLLAERVASQ